MRVKLQLLMCTDDGREETVTDIVTLKKDSQRTEHLGLTLAEAKQLLTTIQQRVCQQQVDALLALHSQGFQLNQQIIFLSDDGDAIRNLQLYMSPEAEHLLDWFHIR